MREVNGLQVAQKFNKELLRRFGLAGMLQEVYSGSLYWALSDILLDVRRWQVPLPIPKSYWKGEQGRERAREATRWVLARLGWGREEGGGYAHMGTLT